MPYIAFSTAVVNKLYSFPVERRSVPLPHILCGIPGEPTTPGFTKADAAAPRRKNCACHSPEAFDCWAARYGMPNVFDAIIDDGGPCECSCHESGEVRG